MELLISLYLIFGGSPKFKTGDCIAYYYEDKAEFWQHRPKYEFSEKIEGVGKKYYKTIYWYGSNTDGLVGYRGYGGNNTIVWVDSYWFQIDCVTLEKK